MNIDGSRVLIVCFLIMCLMSYLGCGRINDNSDSDKTKYSELQLKTERLLLGADKSFGNGPVRYMDFNYQEGELTILIFDETAAFDSANGGAGAHSGSNCLREKFYTKLKDAIDADKRFNVDEGKLAEFIQSFEDTYGKLTDSNDDGTPDVASKDDDGDDILDSVDDDDDNDGVMDWNEPDGNIGGKGNTYNDIPGDGEGKGATGKGRGDGPGDSGPKKGESDFQEPGPDDPENPVNGGTKGEGDG